MRSHRSLTPEPVGHKRGPSLFLVDSGYEILVFFGILAILATFYSFYTGFEFDRKVAEAISRQRSGFKPRVCLVMPCKGAEPGLDRNITSILQQDYGNYFAMIVTDSKQDPAYIIASQILSSSKTSCEARIDFADRHPHASGKVAALLTALSKTKGQAEVYAFVDSDALMPSNWLAELVHPLNDRSIGATTGFRWFFPSRGGFWSQVESAWNASGTNVLFSSRFNFPWGGGIAVRSETLDDVGIEAAWENAISDDMALNSALRHHGYTISFIPQCTVATFNETDLPHLLEWATRQTVLTKVFNPSVWNYGLVAYTFLDLEFLLAVLGLSLSILLDPVWLIPTVLLLTPAFSGFLRSTQRCLTFERALPQWRTELKKNRFRHVVASSVVPWLMMYSIIKSVFTNEIDWRGRRYSLSPTSDAGKAAAAR